ncbi:MAG: response regulator, partial [Bacteroidota bacterium]
ENIPLEINSTPIQQKGEMEGILIIARDITEREQARERIQRYLNDLQIVYEVTSNLLKTENEDEILEIIGNRIHILNPSAYILLSSLDEKETDTLRIKKLFGFQGLVNDIIKTVGTDPREVPIKLSELTEENNHRLKAGRLEHIKGGIFELLNQKLSEDKCRKIEEYLRIHQIYSMGFLHKGKPCGGVTIMLKEGVELNKQSLIENLINQASVALTQKQSEKALEIAKNKAIESDRLKSTFLMNLSHEIRTPLNGIMGFSQILQEREFPFEKQKEFLNIVHNKADQLLNVLNNLLDLSKIEAEQLNIKQEDCYLNDIMYEIYDTYILELEKNKKTAISLSYHCGLKREESRLYSDCSRFRQILNNLVSNAIKFTEEGAIDFGYEFEKSDTLVFYVKDTGIGIPANKKGEIFEPFRQGDESTNREYEGTGLGLSLSKSLVKLLGGSMWVESEEGQGSSFYFTIPYSLHKYKPREAKPDVSEYSYTWPGHKVLIVEDDPVSLEFMQEIFSETRVQIFSAQNGKEALHFFRQNPDINLILMDIRLPDMSGLEVVKNIRLENNHTPIIAQTAYTMDNDAKKCLEAGCTDYLTKPIDIQAMLNVMNKHLKQSI